MAEKHHNTALAENYHLGIFELMQPVGTVCQWRGTPSLKHPGPHQPTILEHPFRNNSKPSTPVASCHFPPHPQSFFPYSVHRKAQKIKKKQKMKTNVDVIHFDFIVAWNYLCSYASTSHIYTHAHTLSSQTQTQKYTHTHTPHSCLF